MVPTLRIGFEGLLALAWLAGSGCESREPSPAPRPNAVALSPSGDTAPQAGVASYAVGTRPRAVAAADLDRDGLVDVVVANSGDGTLTLLLGAGGGRLRASGPAVPAGREPSDLKAADLDRDGDVDLVVANHETSRITVLLNDGRGRFAPAPGSPLETGARPHVHSVAAGDFDGDGWADVAVESADTREIRLLRGGPRGLGAAAGVSVGTMPYFRLGAADVTGDGVVDVLVPGHGDSTVRVVHHAAGTFVLAPRRLAVGDQPWMVVGADVSGDRRGDLVVVHAQAVSVWLAEPDGFAAAPASPFPLRGATEAAAGDLDGDGVADLALGPWEGDRVTLLVGPRLARREVRVCERPIGLAIADLDGDRRGELLAACATTNRLVVLTPLPGR
jgi:hypothetical protein